MSEGVQSPRSVIPYRRLCQIACVIALPALLFLGLRWLLNPTDVNRIVVINEMIAVPAPVYPLFVKLITDDEEFSQRYETGSLSENGGLDVLPWEHAFFSGTLTVTDATSKVVCSIQILPPGRYCRNLVIVIKPDGSVLHDYNEMPSM